MRKRTIAAAGVSAFFFIGLIGSCVGESAEDTKETPTTITAETVPEVISTPETTKAPTPTTTTAPPVIEDDSIELQHANIYHQREVLNGQGDEHVHINATDRELQDFSLSLCASVKDMSPEQVALTMALATNGDDDKIALASTALVIWCPEVLGDLTQPRTF